MLPEHTVSARCAVLVVLVTLVPLGLAPHVLQEVPVAVARRVEGLVILVKLVPLLLFADAAWPSFSMKGLEERPLALV